MSLYHFEIGFPKGLETKFGVIEQRPIDTVG